MDFLADYFTLTNILMAVIAILGLVAVNTGLSFVAEIRDVVEAYRNAKLQSSPGGADITAEEENKIRAEAIDALETVWDRYKDTVFGWLGRLWGIIKFW